MRTPSLPRRPAALAGALLLALLAGGCGQKGPLYLPDAPAAQDAPAAADETEKKKDDGAAR